MENIQNSMMGHPSEDNKKTAAGVVVVGLVLVGALWWWMTGTSQAPNNANQAKTSPAPDVESAQISSEVNNITVEDLNTDFQDIEDELQEL